MKNIRRTFLSLTATTGVALSALMAPQVGFGQEEQAVKSETILDEVIVTANRREQSIQDVSGVVQTLSAQPYVARRQMRSKFFLLGV